MQLLFNAAVDNLAVNRDLHAADKRFVDTAIKLDFVTAEGLKL